MTPDERGEMELISAQPQEMVEGSISYIYLPSISLPNGSVLDALLCMGTREGYPTRLFLSTAVNGTNYTWSPFVIFGRTWYSWSWNYVDASQRPAQVFAQHIRAIR